jgi:hypothetical protein
MSRVTRASQFGGGRRRRRRRSLRPRRRRIAVIQRVEEKEN